MTRMHLVKVYNNDIIWRGQIESAHYPKYEIWAMLTHCSALAGQASEYGDDRTNQSTLVP